MIAYVDQYDNTYTEEEALKLLADAVLGKETKEELVTLEEALDDGRLVTLWESTYRDTTWRLDLSRDFITWAPINGSGNRMVMAAGKVVIGMSVEEDSVHTEDMAIGGKTALMTFPLADLIAVADLVATYESYLTYDGFEAEGYDIHDMRG